VIKVSIIIPTYNRSAYLPKAIASILSQTYQDYEVIVVDDGSEVPVTVPSDSRIRLFRQKNGGVASARNLGISGASSQYLAFLDDDDFWHREYLERQVRFLEDSPQYLGVFCSASKALSDPDASSSCNPLTFHDILSGGKNLNTFLVRRVPEIKFNADYNIGEDWDLFLRLSEIGTLAKSSAVLSFYSSDGREHLAGDQIRNLKSGLRVIKNFKTDNPEHRNLLRNKKDVILWKMAREYKDRRNYAFCLFFMTACILRTFTYKAPQKLTHKPNNSPVSPTVSSL
jgi:glycosyltransferase involved in cell wall biosynthesis